jgi:metallophosphoesterase (TIGR00282 family)
MNVLFAGDIMGSKGRLAFSEIVPGLKSSGRVDIVVVNAENSAGGKGLSPKIAEQLFDTGADVITLGDHAWDQRELVSYIAGEPRIVRPANFSQAAPGKGEYTLDSPFGKLTVMSLIGRVFMKPYNCPFQKADEMLAQKNGKAAAILVDFHAEATSEKMAMGHHLDGRVSAMLGTHTHVQTSDEKVLPGGTAYLTDAGMTGPQYSIIGCEIEAVLKNFTTGMPARFKPAETTAALEGAIMDIDHMSGTARSIERLRIVHGAA